mgnify:CR=1 FL=1
MLYDKFSNHYLHKMKEKLNDILESIKIEFGGLVTLKWSEIGEMLLYMLVLIFLISLNIVLKILLLPYTLVKKLFKKCLWWQNFMLWFTVYIAYKWDEMPNYKIWKVIETRKNGYKCFTQKTLNRWAYWIYKDFRERKM